MSIGMILLIVISLLILFGVLQRVLDRMALSDRQALAVAAAIFAGGWLPDIALGPVRVNIGGALIPLGVCIYLFFHAGTGKERGRCLFAGVVSAAAVTALSWLLPADPTAMAFDPLPLYGAIAGAAAWLTGRSRRSAFIAGILGVLLSDLLSGVGVLMRGTAQPVSLGGAGAVDAVVISGVTAVLLCEAAEAIAQRLSALTARGAGSGGAAEGGRSA